MQYISLYVSVLIRIVFYLVFVLIHFIINHFWRNISIVNTAEKWAECSPMAQETGVQSQIES